MPAFQKSILLNSTKCQNLFSQGRNLHVKQNLLMKHNRTTSFFSADVKGSRMKSTTTTATATNKKESPAQMNRPIYVAATQQHVGKTTTCLSLISGLKKRFPQSIGYLKPVGQQHVPVYSESMGKEIRV